MSSSSAAPSSSALLFTNARIVASAKDDTIYNWMIIDDGKIHVSEDRFNISNLQEMNVNVNVNGNAMMFTILFLHVLVLIETTP